MKEYELFDTKIRTLKIINHNFICQWFQSQTDRIEGAGVKAPPSFVGWRVATIIRVDVSEQARCTLGRHGVVPCQLYAG